MTIFKPVAMKKGFSSLLREPMIGFAIAGGLIFLAYYALAGSQREVIEISPAAVSDLVQMRTELLGRSLTESERRELVDEHVNQEILLREAVAQGLYLGDGQVRKRLVDKMDFLIVEEPPQPTSEALQRLYEEHPERYRTPPTISFEQVYFPGDRDAAERVLPGLQDGQPAPPDAGETFWLGRELLGYSPTQLVTLFGAGFTRRLAELKQDVWSGPIPSGRGWHLVRVLERRQPEPLPELERNRRLREDWIADLRLRTRGQRLAELRQGYQVLLPEETAQ